MPPESTEFHLSVKTLITELVLGELLNINQRLAQIESNQRKIMASQDQEAAALNAIGDQLNKALAELVAALANLGQTSPEVDAATARLQAAAQALDDLNPDPAPAPAPEPAP